MGSLVTFIDGTPDKSLYRRYRIKTVHRADDYAMMEEVLTRRFTRGIAENDLPDLLIVDGGKGQLNIALDVLRNLNVQNLQIAALAKPTAQETGLPPYVLKYSIPL